MQQVKLNQYKALKRLYHLLKGQQICIKTIKANKEFVSSIKANEF